MNTREFDAAQAAELHYIDGLSQKEVAEKLHVSTATVSRLIREAREAGLVEISIKRPANTMVGAERKLEQTLGLKSARVVAGDAASDSSTRRELGAAGAELVRQHLADGGIFGVCWGQATRLVIEQLRPITTAPVDVVQMIGSAGTHSRNIDGSELTRLAAHALGGTYDILNAPLVVDDSSSATLLLNQSAIKEVLQKAKRANVSLLGLGSAAIGFSALQRAGYLSASQVKKARDAGAVGDVSGILINQAGKPVFQEFSSRVIGLNLEQIRRLRNTIAVAFGQEKTAIISAAARSGLIRELVTDLPTAQALLSIDSKE